jgi:hypothetical protein
VVMMNPFKAMLIDRRTEAIRMVVTIDFEREVRSERGANRAVTKVQQAKDR